MTRFEGGYTEGIGSTVWEAEFADRWRDGWCALGVYCAVEGGDQDAADDQADGGSVDAPRGLYEVGENVLFVNTEFEDVRSTVSHEFTHALQHQNFPALGALHLWYNRDLAAAGNTVVEGGAHVVGWSFSDEQRVRLCAMAPTPGVPKRPRWWQWKAEDFRAHEIFPHAFGPELALERLLADGTDGLDALLEDPPLSTLAVLDPAHAGPVDFIKLPVASLAEATAAINCEVGLRNTAGAVGIWGLLREHGGASGNESVAPAFIGQWRGDRFAHLACPGDDNDELAWLIRWRTAAAAEEFAQGFHRVAASILQRGGVLGAAPTAVVRDRSVIVLTPGLEEARAAVAKSEVRTFSHYADWIASGCFPEENCYEPEQEDAGQRSDNPCSPDVQPPVGIVDWLNAVRRARDAVANRHPGFDGLAETTGTMAVFCTRNTMRNTDLRNACRAVYSGVEYLTRLNDNRDWRLLPHCLDESGFRTWIEKTYYADADRPFAAASIVTRTYGPARAAQAMQHDGTTGLSALLAAPPLSTLHLIRPEVADPVEFIAVPRIERAGESCQVHASDVQGVLGIWNLLMDSGQAPEQDALPWFLLDWRGDRQSFLRCGTEQGWVWISRWSSPDSARAFAAHYRRMVPNVARETGLSADSEVDVDGRTVWIVPQFFKELQPILKNAVEFRSFTDFRDWVAGGCFPQDACN